MSELVIDVSVSDFEREVLAASQRVPVLVDFWAPWCGPCRALGPILEKLAAEYQGRFILAKVNSDENQELAAQYGVRGIPNVKAFVGGELVDEFTGALPESRIREFIENLLPSPAEPLRQQARVAQAAGDYSTARTLLQQALALDARNEAVRLDLIELALEQNELDTAQQGLASLPAQLRDAARRDRLAARLALAQGAAGGGDEAELRQRIAANGDDLDARLMLANRLALHNDYAAALEELLEIVARDRSFRDDIGRKTMLQIFGLLGSGDARVREYRARLASLLNR